jgi:lysophospholipase L1-like esterase
MEDRGMRERLIELGLIGFGFFIVIVSMVAIEFGLRKFTPHVLTLYKPDEYIGWKAIPGKEQKIVNETTVSYVKMKSHGFRDRERTYEKGKDVFRIAVLGDSMTEALQVPLDKAFPYVLEEKLNSENDKRFEVLNLGVSGFGTAQEYLMLKHYGLEYKPDLVILEFCIINDVRDNSSTLRDDPSRPYFVLNSGELEELPFRIKPGSTVGVTEHSRILNFLVKFFPNISYSLKDRIKQTPWLANLLWKIGIVNSKPDLPDKYNKKNGVPIIDDYVYAEKYSPEWENAWKVTEGLILKLKEELETEKIEFLVVVVPNEFEFRPDMWNKTLDEYPQMKSVKFDLRKPERILSDFLEKNKIDYLLLRPEFEQYTKETGKNLHFHSAYENHWNANGHALAAELIYRKLKDSNMVPHKGGHV